MSPVKIYVGNIPSSARSSELKELFEKFGKVIESDILKEFGFVHMDDTNDAKAAIAGLNDTLWKGARIRVEKSTTRTKKGEPSQHKRFRGNGRTSPYRPPSRFNGRRGSLSPRPRRNHSRSRSRDRYGGGGASPSYRRHDHSPSSRSFRNPRDRDGIRNGSYASDRSRPPYADVYDRGGRDYSPPPMYRDNGFDPYMRNGHHGGGAPLHHHHIPASPPGGMRDDYYRGDSSKYDYDGYRGSKKRSYK